MPTSALRLFELREVAPGAELSEGTQRVAVALPDSSALRQSAIDVANLEYHADLQTVCPMPPACCLGARSWTLFGVQACRWAQ